MHDQASMFGDPLFLSLLVNSNLSDMIRIISVSSTASLAKCVGLFVLLLQDHLFIHD